MRLYDGEQLNRAPTRLGLKTKPTLTWIEIRLLDSRYPSPGPANRYHHPNTAEPQVPKIYPHTSQSPSPKLAGNQPHPPNNPKILPSCLIHLLSTVSTA